MMKTIIINDVVVVVRVADVVLVDATLNGGRDGVLTVGHGRRFAHQVLVEAADAAVVIAVDLRRR